MTKQQIMQDWVKFEIHPERISDEYGEFYLKVYKKKYTYARSALLRVAELELEIEECERMNNFYRLNIKELEEKNKNLMGFSRVELSVQEKSVIQTALVNASQK